MDLTPYVPVMITPDEYKQITGNDYVGGKSQRLFLWGEIVDEQTKMLMEIKEDIAQIKQQLTGLPSTDDKADKAYNASQDNARDISSLKKMVWSIWGVLGGTIGITLFVYIIEKFL